MVLYSYMSVLIFQRRRERFEDIERKFRRRGVSDRGHIGHIGHKKDREYLRGGGCAVVVAVVLAVLSAGTS